jgi:hypothetical protein
VKRKTDEEQKQMKNRKAECKSPMRKQKSRNGPGLPVQWVQLLALVLVLAGGCAGAQNVKKGELLFKARFNDEALSDQWVVELQGGEGSRVYTRSNVLVLDTRQGVSVWLRQPLSGNYIIEFTRTVLSDGRTNDRVSDLNQFWAARDPINEDFFSGRSGAFSDYDRLQLYYVGMGGNDNKTTRFRRYDGRGGKPIIGEYTDKAHLLAPNKAYRIAIIVRGSATSFWVNGEQYFSYEDSQPLAGGFFGFRSLHSRQEIADLTIHRLD